MSAISKFFTLTVTIFLSAFLFQTLQAQSLTTTKTDSTQIKRAQDVYVELGGAGLFISINYDTRFTDQRAGFGGRIGAGYWHLDGYSFLTVPLQVNYLFGKKSNFLELGLGGTLLSYNKTSNEAIPVGFNGTRIGDPSVQGILTLGYRYQPIKGGFSFRASLDPLFNSKTIVPLDYFGISFGYIFR